MVDIGQMNIEYLHKLKLIGDNFNCTLISFAIFCTFHSISLAHSLAAFLINDKIKDKQLKKNSP